MREVVGSAAEDDDEAPASAVPPVSSAYSKAMSASGRLYAAYGRHYQWPQNVVTKAWLASSVNLRKFTAKRPHSYIPPKFWAAVDRMRNQQGSASLVFRTGRVVIVGTRSMAQTYQAAHRLRMSLAEEQEQEGMRHRHTKLEEFRHVNMVFNKRAKSKHGIDIASIHSDNQDKTEWVPTMFPGLKYEMSDEHVKLRLFDTREIVVMGATRPDRVRAIFDKATDLVHSYPDYHLPASNMRYNYRKEQQRRALVDIATHMLSGEEGGGVEDSGIILPQL